MPDPQHLTPHTQHPIPPDWLPGLEAIRALPTGGVALLVGATDRGKTTFAAMAAATLAGELPKVAVVDADIGQSEIGPPGTVGMAAARADAGKLHDLKPSALFFVGAFAPNTAALELLAATGQAVRYARERGASRILVDTSGFVSGPAARRLKVAKAQIIQPNLIVALSHPGELDSLAAAMAAACGASVVILPVPEAVGKKPQSLRATRRLTRLSSALANVAEATLPLSGVATVGATLGTGTPLTPELVRWCAETLRLPIVYGERGESGLTLWASGTPRGGWEAASGPIAAHFDVRSVRVLALSAHEGVYLGLHDETGRLLSLGLFHSLDAERGELNVLAPPSARPDRIRLVAFGRVRLAADGNPLGEIKPGEL